MQLTGSKLRIHSAQRRESPKLFDQIADGNNSSGGRDCGGTHNDWLEANGQGMKITKAGSEVEDAGRQKACGALARAFSPKQF